MCSNIITCIAIIIVLYCIYLLIRNQKVLNLQISIIHGGFGYLYDYLRKFTDDEEFKKHAEEYVLLKIKVDEIIYRYPYHSMLFSFRPLKLESWYNPEEVKILTTSKLC